MTLKPNWADRERAMEFLKDQPLDVCGEWAHRIVDAYLRGYLAAKAEDAEAVRKLPRFDEVLEYDGGIELKSDGDYIAYHPAIEAIIAGRETGQ